MKHFTPLTLALACLCAPFISASAQTDLFTPVDFTWSSGAVETGFQNWGGSPALTESSGTYPANTSWTITTAGTISGQTTVDISASAGKDIGLFGRSSLTDGTPSGFTYAQLYNDFIFATDADGSLTLSFSDLDPNTQYNFTLYTYDPGSTDTTAKVWGITEGTGDPTSNSVAYNATLEDNNTFAMEFAVTTTGTGTFAVQNTGGTAQAVLNGFALSTIPEPSAFALFAGLGALCLVARRRARES